MTTAETERATRPRVAGEREEEILDGVVELLIEVGYDRLTFDSVAARVRVSKATLYRRWTGKPDLVMSAVEQLFARAEAGRAAPADAGSLEGDMEAMFCHSPEMLEQLPAILAGSLSALHRDPELSAEFTERVVKPKIGLIRAVLERARARGEIGPGADLDLLAGVLPAMNLYRIMTLGQCPDDDFVRAVVGDLLLPACRATLVADSG